MTNNIDILDGCTLTEAVILQAVEDYKEVLKTLKKAERVVQNAVSKKEELESFFKSEDFICSAPANVDGQLVIEAIKAQVGYTYD